MIKYVVLIVNDRGNPYTFSILVTVTRAAGDGDGDGGGGGGGVVPRMSLVDSSFIILFRKKNVFSFLFFSPLADRSVHDKVDFGVLLLDPVVAFGLVLPLIHTVAAPRCRIKDLLGILKPGYNFSKRGEAFFRQKDI